MREDRKSKKTTDAKILRMLSMLDQRHPTTDEIAKECGISAKEAYSRIYALESRGFVGVLNVLVIFDRCLATAEIAKECSIGAKEAYKRAVALESMGLVVRGQGDRGELAWCLE